MEISQYISQKIKALSFISIILVLFIHGVFLDIKDFPVTNYIQKAFGFNGFGIVANPLFFSISGFLFFRNIQTINDCIPKINKRLKSLFIPYIIWNVLFISWFVVCGLILPFSNFLNSGIIGELINNSFLYDIYLLFIKPVAFHLWYVRDLLLYILVSPLIYLLLIEIKIIILPILFVLGEIGLFYFPPTIKLWGLFFFVLGGYIAIYKDINQINIISKPLFIFSFLIYLSNAIFHPFLVDNLKGHEMVVEVCGIITLWKGYDYLYLGNIKITNKLTEFGQYTFFIYCFHEPVFNIIKKISFLIAGTKDSGIVIIYFMNSLIMIISSIVIAKFLKHKMPNFYKLLTGGR